MTASLILYFLLWHFGWVSSRVDSTLDDTSVLDIELLVCFLGWVASRLETTPDDRSMLDFGLLVCILGSLVAGEEVARGIPGLDLLVFDA